MIWMMLQPIKMETYMLLVKLKDQQITALRVPISQLSIQAVTDMLDNLTVRVPGYGEHIMVMVVAFTVVQSMVRE